MVFMDKYVILEKSLILLLMVFLLVVMVGGIVEIVFLFWLENIIEEVDGVWFYLLFELVGCDIYICEGCYVCYSQMICLMWDEVECYGYYLLVVESMYDYLF